MPNIINFDSLFTNGEAHFRSNSGNTKHGKCWHTLNDFSLCLFQYLVSIVYLSLSLSLSLFLFLFSVLSILQTSTKSNTNTQNHTSFLFVSFVYFSIFLLICISLLFSLWQCLSVFLLSLILGNVYLSLLLCVQRGRSVFLNPHQKH